MSSIIYENKEYKSKSELIRYLYENGKVTNESYSKSSLAKELGIAVQTVHATLAKIIETSSNKIKMVSTKVNNEKLSNKKTSEIIIVRSGEEIVGNCEKLIKISWAPNPWGLPITNPPIYVIDPNFKEDLKSYSNDKNSTSDFIQY
jgi:hypothetical protein